MAKKLPHAKQEAVDAAVRKHKGKAAVECVIRSSHSKKWTPYQIFGLSDGRALYVQTDTLAAHILPPSTALAKRWAQQVRRQSKS